MATRIIVMASLKALSALALMFAVASCDEQAITVRVTEVSCGDSWSVGTPCNEATKKSDLLYRLNAAAHTAAMTVEHNTGDWLVTSELFDHCTIVDADNWECTQQLSPPPYPSINRIGMSNGEYYRFIEADSKPTYINVGVSGWRYWLPWGVNEEYRYRKVLNAWSPPIGTQ